MKNIMIGTWAWGTGINGSSMIFGKKQNPEILKEAFEEAVKLGFLHWDTAAVYGMGTCESFLGTMINEHEDIFISTKFAPFLREILRFRKVNSKKMKNCWLMLVFVC